MVCQVKTEFILGEPVDELQRILDVKRGVLGAWICILVLDVVSLLVQELKIRLLRDLTVQLPVENLVGTPDGDRFLRILVDRVTTPSNAFLQEELHGLVDVE